ncbi:hypothetical protein [Nocardioides luteus]|uniref:Uncharacterized protein n=1 Tax=Nocardioides luteus TaxID=1844 RepID=A0A1J4N6G3_9ACTN|nr:hypothetical protein [Nocardioides luteus]OIJ26240.1 hypothetical protein UG56_013415 [Nocardioides luteus]
MTSRAVDGSRSLLTLGRVDSVRVQVGYRASPEAPVDRHYLLDLSVPEPDGGGGEDVLDERRVLAALEPVLYAGADARRHYSLHQHRWHTSWGASPGALEIGLLVDTGPRTTVLSEASYDGVTDAFRDVMELVGRPERTPTSRTAAVHRARGAAATAYAQDPDALSLRAEEHHPSDNSWTLTLRSTAGEEYDVVVGFVEGYAGSVSVRHLPPIEASDSIGPE